MKVLPSVKDFTQEDEKPFLEYRFIAGYESDYFVDLYLAPSNTAYMDHKLFYGIQINDSVIRFENAVEEDFRSLDCGYPDWVNAVRNNIRIRKTRVFCQKGINHLRIYAVSPFFVLERIVLYKDKLPESYLGPKESYYKR
jgi:hypothetical protein